MPDIKALTKLTKPNATRLRNSMQNNFEYSVRDTFDDLNNTIAAFLGQETNYPPTLAGVPHPAWILKDGSEVSRSTYPALWNWVNTVASPVDEATWQNLKLTSPNRAVSVYSTGDGSTTFRVPDVGDAAFQRPASGTLPTDATDLQVGYESANKQHAHSSPTVATNADADTDNGEPYWAARTQSTTTGAVPTERLDTYPEGNQYEARPSFQYVKTYIYAGGSTFDLPIPTPEWLQQQAVNTQNIADLQDSQGGSGTPTFQVVSTDTQMGNYKGYLVDVSGGAVTMTFPRDPVNDMAGWVVTVGDYNGNASWLNPIVLTSLDPIEGSGDDFYITSRNAKLVFSYVDDTRGWTVVDGIGEDANDVEPYEEVIIFNNAAGGNKPSRITLPAGYVWTDFEKIEWSPNNAGTGQIYNSAIVQKEHIDAYPDNFFVQVRYDSPTTAYNVTFQADSTTSGTCTYVANSEWGVIKGYTKYKPVLNRTEYPTPWVVIGEAGAPPYLNSLTAMGNALGLRYRFETEDTIHVLGSVSGSINGTTACFNFPTNITNRINIRQFAPMSGDVTGSVVDYQGASIVQANGTFQLLDNVTTGVFTAVHVDQTIVLDT